jgi:hypothetical protein
MRTVSRLTSELEQEKRDAKQGVELSVLCMLLLSYADMISDIYVAMELLGTLQASYGIVDRD